MRWLMATFCALAITGAIIEESLQRSAGRPAAAGPVAAPHVPRRPWLGLNGNTSSYLGPLDTFSRAGVTFDRSFDLIAGELPNGRPGSPGAEARKRMAEDHALGMSPVVVIEYRGYDRPGFEFRPDPRFPNSRAAGRGATIAGYVAGFLRTARAMRSLAARYPGTEVRFEVMNEPWGYTIPQYDAARYAEVLAALLPAAAAAGIPGADIYAAAVGQACVPAGCETNGWVPAMYRAEPALRQSIEGWYLHPYGPASGLSTYDNGGIDAVPLIRARMASGRQNLIVSELGFCAREVNNPQGERGGVACDGTTLLSAGEAAASLQTVLRKAQAYHREGWLKALIIFSRNDGGWAMQLPGGAFTPSGRALLRFAAAEGA